jgi:hypothetical protein
MIQIVMIIASAFFFFAMSFGKSVRHGKKAVARNQENPGVGLHQLK